MKIGKIISAYGGKYTASYEGVFYHLSPRGSVAFKSGEVLPGDDVVFDEATMTIESICERANHLPRPRVCNLTQIMVVSSAVEPDLSPLLIYKTLAYASMHGIKAFLVITKTDRVNDMSTIAQFTNDLALIGTDVLLLSKKVESGLAQLIDRLRGNVTLAIGQTGVGKSTLINRLDPHFDRAIGEYSKALGRGRHKTKDVIFLPYEDGFIVDSPGFSSLELDLYKEDLACFFPGFKQAVGKCFYRDCLHLGEKGCEVQRLVKKNIVSREAYLIYQKLIDELQYKNRRYHR